MADIFSSNDYRPYLRSRLEGKRGLKSQFAVAVHCDGAYVSRVLEGSAQLSLEQGMRANAFLGHTAEESELFLTQIGWARAGSKELKDYYLKRIEALKDQHRTLSKRIKNTESLPEINQATYYSLWLYAAIDIATSIPSLQTSEALSRHFHIPLEAVTSILGFLSQCGVVERKEGRWVNTNRSIYLTSDSPHIRKHHLNWRLKAMQLIDQMPGETPYVKNLHYSSVVSLSRKDFEALKEHFIQTVSRAREIVKGSRDETIAVYNIDCFELGG